MTLTDKLFSLLGFAEPVTLKRATDKNILPEIIYLLSLNNQINSSIQNATAQLNSKIVNDLNNNTVEALIIDATDYSGESSYQHLYSTVQKALKYLSLNARIIIITNTISSQKNEEKNAFSQAIIGFSKSLAKEVGRKGSTVNVLLIDDHLHNTDDALINPIKFFLSKNSAFVSGQKLKINSKNTANKNSNKTKVAVVTGAAQGIGAAIANKLTQDGYRVIGVDIEPMKTQLTESMRNLQGEFFILDVSAENAGEQLAVLAIKYGGFDLIVHNAGITRDKTLAKMPAYYWQQTININLLSVMRINKVLLNEKCINTGGSIVCLSSMNGIAGQGGQTNYACSKAGIIGYVHGMCAKLTVNNITINAVAPGFIETQMTEKMPFFTREMGRRMNALSQGGLPIDVAEAVAFLGSNSNFSISGQTLRVCGLNIIGS